ncbi:MAG: hypothetical protein ACXVFQ_21800 [Solirubrobacteraceae bacterium]
MRPELNNLIAQQRTADLYREADRARLAWRGAPEPRPGREHSRIAQLLARLVTARA